MNSLALIDIEIYKITSKRSQLYETAVEKNEAYFLYSEWLDTAITARDVAHSNYIYALSMIEQISQSESPSSEAIDMWRQKRDTAYCDYQDALNNIATYEPIVEETGIAANEAVRAYNKYFEETDNPLFNLLVLRVINREDVRTAVDNIIGYINDAIQAYKDNAQYSGNGFADEIEILESEKSHYENSYSGY